jgi:hypothetical protein
MHSYLRVAVLVHERVLLDPIHVEGAAPPAVAEAPAAAAKAEAEGALLLRGAAAAAALLLWDAAFACCGAGTKDMHYPKKPCVGLSLAADSKVDTGK